jgi:hypothetical protein
MSQRQTAASLLLLAALGGTGSLGAADRDRFISEPMDVNPNVQEAEPWKEESPVHLPPWPQDASLVEFRASDPAASLRYYIDTKSLSVDAQKIVRYTVVAETKTGARNVSYEGIRCTPKGEHRLYAYGVAGKFQTVPDTPWRRASDTAVPPYARDLQQFYLCVPLKFEPRPLKEMPRILSGHGNARDQSGFLTD